MVAVCKGGFAYDKLKLSFLKRHRKKSGAEHFLIVNGVMGAEGDFLNNDWKLKELIELKKLNRQIFNSQTRGSLRVF